MVKISITKISVFSILFSFYFSVSAQVMFIKVKYGDSLYRQLFTYYYDDTNRFMLKDSSRHFLDTTYAVYDNDSTKFCEVATYKNGKKNGFYIHREYENGYLKTQSKIFYSKGSRYYPPNNDTTGNLLYAEFSDFNELGMVESNEITSILTGNIETPEERLIANLVGSYSNTYIEGLKHELQFISNHIGEVDNYTVSRESLIVFGDSHGDIEFSVNFIIILDLLDGDGTEVVEFEFFKTTKRGQYRFDFRKNKWLKVKINE